MDWNLLSFTLPIGATHPDHPEVDPGREDTAMQTKITPAQRESVKGQAAVMTGQNEWTHWATLALVLDAITIGCIVWLLMWGR